MQLFTPELSILPENQRTLWPLFAQLPSEFVLYGGTAVALQLAHRQSIDFDFFSSKAFTPEDLAQRLRFLETAAFLQYQPNTLTILTSSKVKLSFFGGLSIGRVRLPKTTSDTSIRIASLLDMLAFKLKVLLQRVEAKDYLDILAIMTSGISLDAGLSAACALFGNSFPAAEALKTLTYFEGGDLGTLKPEAKTALISYASKVSGSIEPCPLESVTLDQ